MSKLRSAVLATAVLLSPAGFGGCATIIGTAVSPVTGAVDLTRQFVNDGIKDRYWALPFVFLGGAVSGPFVAMFNGVNHDASVFKSFGRYWNEFDAVFRPFEMIRRW
ncbi:MAG: hypothetical protein HZB39_00090 [Planctomycetes bacterium]|nr:hypothetical protein [Planctomycetota bacterium]